MITAIIQARMGSTRLPGKALMNIKGKPLLWHLLERIKRSKAIDRIIIATTFNPKDKAILSFAKDYGVEVFRGDENDVLDRCYQAAKSIKAETIVRTTPDCPLICPEVIDEAVAAYRKGRYDYVTNTLVYTYPDGCDVEVFSFKALEKAWKECKDMREREHVTPYIRSSGAFKLKNIESKNPVDPREYKWSVDKTEDLEFVKEVYKHLYKEGGYFSIKEVMNLLQKHPGIRKINQNMIVNEGYYKSFLGGPKIKATKLKVTKSLELKKKAESIIPDCSQTFSKGPSQFVQGAAPVFLEKGKGSHVWDVDGNEYIDYAMALGPVILGHNYPVVTGAVKKALEKGATFSLPHRLEFELAELLCGVIPCAQMARFAKNGSDATSGAVRVARAYTKRDKIACAGYHGWQDWYIATTTRDSGIPEDIKKLSLAFEYNRIETLEKIFKENKNQIACVIMEPVGVVEPKEGFLEEVKRLTHKNGAILIFDEVVTGFRVSLGGAQSYYNVIPDLACFGKAMGNGFPISAIVGKREIMKLFNDIFYSLTFGGEIVSLTASIATIKEMRCKKVIGYLWEQGRKIKDGYNCFAREYGMEKYTQCIGMPPRTVITFKNERGEEDLALKSLFQQECIKRGILFTACHLISFSHTNKDIDYTLKVYRTVLEILKDAIRKKKVKKLLTGSIVKSVFRKA